MDLGSARLVNSRPTTATGARFGKYLLSAYEATLLLGFRSGLTQAEISSMLKSGKYFNSPVHGNSLLLKVRLRLLLIRLAASISGQYGKLRPCLRSVLRRLEVLHVDRWNPALAKSRYAFGMQGDYELALYVIPSPSGFDWSSPRGLLFSLGNYLSRSHSHKIGHAFAVLKNNGTVIAATGMTGETNLQSACDLLLNRNGLSFMFRSFRGRLECAQFVQNDILKHQAMSHIETLNFALTEEQFERCMDYLQKWCVRGGYRSYGLAFGSMDPSGASCTSFAVSFLAVAGVLRSEHERSWVREVRVADDFFGHNDRRIGLFRLIFMLLTRKSWLNRAEKYREIRFWDPDLMYRWIKCAVKSYDYPA